MARQYLSRQFGSRLADTGNHRGEKRNLPILAPNRPRLEVQMLLLHCGYQQLGGSWQVGSRHDLLDRHQRCFADDVCGAALKQLMLGRKVFVDRGLCHAGALGDVGIAGREHTVGCMQLGRSGCDTVLQRGLLPAT